MCLSFAGLAIAEENVLVFESRQSALKDDPNHFLTNFLSATPEVPFTQDSEHLTTGTMQITENNVAFGVFVFTQL